MNAAEAPTLTWGIMLDRAYEERRKSDATRAHYLTLLRRFAVTLATLESPYTEAQA